MPNSTATHEALTRRSGGQCELCQGEGPISAYPVPPMVVAGLDRVVATCTACATALDGGGPLDPNRWQCLNEAFWSEVPAVQVVSYRLLGRLSEHGWARELIEQRYLDDDVLAWARSGMAAPEEAHGPATVDSNGNTLNDGDSVTIIKDLDVKGSSFVAKRGTTVKNIRLTDDPALIEGKVNGVAIYLKTCFLKRL